MSILGICILCLCYQPLSAQEEERDQDQQPPEEVESTQEEERDQDQQPLEEVDSILEEDRDQEQHPLEESDSLKRTSFNVWPYAFYTPEVSLAFGGGGIFIFYTADDPIVKPSKIGFSGYYSINKQYKVGVNPVFYFFENKLFFKVPTTYAYMVDKFWGIGNDTPDIPNPSFTRKVFNTTITVQLPPLWFISDRTGIIFDYDKTTMVDKRDNQLLLNDVVTGSNGGQSFGVGTDLLWDTRDNIFFPNTGGYQYFKWMVYSGTAGDFQYASMEMDVRHFRAIKPDHVIAGQFYLSSVTGDPPFYKLPAIGGSSHLRGYFTGRYRDDLFMMLQLEYRQYFWKRFGFVVFAGAGDVAPDLMRFKFDYLKYSFGGGLRFMFNQKEKVNLRADVGFGRPGNIGVYFGIEEAF